MWVLKPKSGQITLLNPIIKDLNPCWIRLLAIVDYDAQPFGRYRFSAYQVTRKE